ncbi:MAG: 23S rRNA (guanosine(2251)-2'-O)-methyltransferase RlmB [Proteobacteria bacterium]|nr:23S rRNA (guanosine(2251)-2'-O)-methyltransferase RlmB [Pseudomonadota bacterium]
MSRSKSPKNRQKIASGTLRKKRAPSPASPSRRKQASPDDSWIYGDHPTLAALANRNRKIKRLVLTEAKMSSLNSEMKGLIQEKVAPELLERETISGLLPENALHQSIAIQAAPLKELSIEDLPSSDNDQASIIAVLDQVSDPHNVGAILRSAAAFNISAIILPDRHSPPISGTLAKSASGAVELVPMIRVANLSRALETLAQKGYWRIGLDGLADQSLETAAKDIRKIALVLGSEGRGLRQLTAEKCDLLAKLPIDPKMESLNVSNAAAIAFYELARQAK